MTDSIRQLDTPQHPRPLENRHNFRWDLTVNIPTVITLLSLTVGIATFGVTKYTELTKADDQAASAIVSLRVEVDKISVSQSGVVREMREGMDNIRKENRDDFKEVRGTLERINDRLSTGSSNQSMKGWQK